MSRAASAVLANETPRLPDAPFMATIETHSRSGHRPSPLTPAGEAGASLGHVCLPQREDMGAVFVASVGFFQWRTAQQKASLDLFERRHAIYEIVRRPLAKWSHPRLDSIKPENLNSWT
jgi:hypothetical protein